MTLSTKEAIIRFDENEDRINKFVNEYGTYTPNSGLPNVETLPSFIQRNNEALNLLTATNVQGVWTTSTLYSVWDEVQYSGTWYRCVVAHTSTGTFDSTKWRISQGVTTGQLSLSNGSTLIGHTRTGSNVVTRTVSEKINDDVSAKDYSTLQDAWNALPDRGILKLPYNSYPITSTLNFTNKGGVRVKFEGQLLYAGGLSGNVPAVYFKGVSQSEVDGLYVIGNKTGVSKGVHFDADSSNITIHQKIGKIVVSECDTGVVIGNNSGFQYSDSNFEDVYASDCNVGVKLTGENTLAMTYGRLAAYNNSTIGVHFEQGGGSVQSLQVAASGSDLFFGQTDGANHNKLNRWDILSGYSEMGISGERWIDSSLCSDTNPFYEEVVISGARVTPFSSVVTPDFIRWKLNGDLIIKNCTITHGQQLPVVAVDHNTSYRAPSVIIDGGVVDANPKSSPQLSLSYTLTNPDQYVEINARFNNAVSFWQNNGSSNEGVIKKGIYMRKIKDFEKVLLSFGNLKSAWTLRELPSGTCKNTVVGAPSLILSSAMERRDFWLDDGLVGFFKNTTSSKTLSTNSSTLNLKSEYTFGMILRAVGTGTDETSVNTLGGSNGIRLGIGDTGGAFVRCQVGSYNCQASPSNPLDPHLVIGRYLSNTHIKVDAINLRTGQISSATTGAPIYTDLTWTNGVSMRNDLCVRGMTFVYDRSLTDAETKGILQSALSLTDTWK